VRPRVAVQLGSMAQAAVIACVVLALVTLSATGELDCIELQSSGCSLRGGQAIGRVRSLVSREDESTSPRFEALWLTVRIISLQ